MKSLFVTKKINYDGTQLRPLWAYENFGILGNSVISFIGSCNISFQNMVDLEDKIAKEKIKGSLMLHFIIEVFDVDLKAAVGLQRLLASIVKDEVQNSAGQNQLTREGDDVYWLTGSGKKKEKKKLSISIASKSVTSSQIHFAVNISNRGTPVKTCSLEDFKINPKNFSKKIMKSFVVEFLSICEATQKVRCL
jgi:uncharacterized protein